MSDPHSDALVFFGATGDLAYKKIFPSLQAMVKRGHLNVPVIGVAKAGWNLDQLQARARDSVEKHGGLDPAAFDKLCGLLRYVDGDYNDPATFQPIRKELGSAQRPAHYLAIPPALFGLVVEQLAKAGCTKGARVIVEKPFGRDLASARELNRILLGDLRRGAHLPHRPLPRQAAGAQHAVLPLRQFVSGAVLEPQPRRERADHHGGGLRRPGPRRFYDQTGTIRDVVQNHLFQVLANLAMEPPVRTDSESIRDEKVKVLKAIRAAGAEELVRGQFRGYRNEKGVAPDSKVETFAALKLEVDSWRWQGVPFYIRAGKSLPVTCTEILVRLRRPPTVFPTCTPAPNYFRFRISPDVTIAFGLTVMDAGREDDRPDQWNCWRAAIPARTRWTPTNACSATPWRATPRCSPARTTWKRPGASSIRC